MKIIKVPKSTKLFFCSDIHEHEEQFFKLINEIKPDINNWFISLGDVYDKGYGIKAAERIIDKIKDFSDNGFGFFIKGNHELKHLNKAKKENITLSSQLEWVNKQPAALLFEFFNGSKVLAVHGGVTPHQSLDDVFNKIDVCYIRCLDKNGKSIPLKRKKINEKIIYQPTKVGKVWHEIYDGRFGYIVSGHHNQDDGVPKFYNFSCNIDTGCFNTGKLTALEITEFGTKGKTIIISGSAKYKNA